MMFSQNRIHPQSSLHHEPMIVCAVLNIFAVRTDLCAQRLIEPRPAHARAIEAD